MGTQRTENPRAFRPGSVKGLLTVLFLDAALEDKD
jgi:hypothetical protein